MQEDRHREEQGDEDPKREVNPAARHDSDRGKDADRGKVEEPEQVPPVQEEPLDPLGPGGIGG